MRLIRSTYEVVTEESAQDGEAADSGWLDKEGQEFNSPAQAIRYLKSRSITQASSSRFHSGIWYSTTPEKDTFDGSYTTESYHLKGFTERAERMIYDALFPSRNG